ncbi:MAG: fused MFS/spermidine synthase [Planctomycetia bacterium]
MDADAPVDGRRAAWPALAGAALSGVTALVAQTVWIRALGRALGTTTESLAAVAGIFLAGVGLGAWWGGRLARRSGTPALAATRALLGSALLVAASPWLFQALPDVHLAVLRLLGAEPGPNPWPALVVALPLLLLPTLLMGCTFPLLVAARQRSGAGAAVGLLYGVNTAGAAVGTLATVLALPVLGERLVLLAAATCEALAALMLWQLARPGGEARTAAPGAAPETAPVAPAGDAATVPAPAAAPLPGTRRARVGGLLALTGLCGLGAEVAAFRLLEPLAGPHLWGVALLLLPVLAGLALGGVLGGRVAARTARPVRALTVALLLCGLGLLALPTVAGLLPRLLLEAGSPLGLARVGLLALGNTLALLPLMVASGACFPLAVRLAREGGEGEAEASGRLGACNALGSLAGSLLVGFALLPLLGATHVLLLLASLLLAAAPLWHLAHAPAPRVGVACVAALPLGLLALPPVHAAPAARAGGGGGPAPPHRAARGRRALPPAAGGRRGRRALRLVVRRPAHAPGAARGRAAAAAARRPHGHGEPAGGAGRHGAPAQQRPERGAARPQQPRPGQRHRGGAGPAAGAVPSRAAPRAGDRPRRRLDG